MMIASALSCLMDTENKLEVVAVNDAALHKPSLRVAYSFDLKDHGKDIEKSFKRPSKDPQNPL